MSVHTFTKVLRVNQNPLWIETTTINLIYDKNSYLKWRWDRAMNGIMATEPFNNYCWKYIKFYIVLLNILILNKPIKYNLWFALFTVLSVPIVYIKYVQYKQRPPAGPSLWLHNHKRYTLQFGSYYRVDEMDIHHVWSRKDHDLHISTPVQYRWTCSNLLLSQQFHITTNAPRQYTLIHSLHIV